MHACVVSALENAVGLKVAESAAAEGATAAAFKKAAGEAVRVRDVRSMRREAKSTVCHHLRVLGGPETHATRLQQYLSGPLTEVQRFKFICRAGVLPTPAGRRYQQGRARTARCPFCPERPAEETIHHALLACSAFAAERAALWARMEQEVGLRCLLTGSWRPCWGMPSGATVLRQWMASSSSTWVCRCGGGGRWCHQRVRRGRRRLVTRLMWRARHAAAAVVRPLCCCAIAVTGGTTCAALFRL